MNGRDKHYRRRNPPSAALCVRADDLVQDTLERALCRWPLWRPGNLRAWLFAIMHNQFVNQVRSPQGLEYPGDDALPDLPTLAAQSDALELSDLANGLMRLPAEQFEVLLAGLVS